ncbi:MAG: hypothetical protein HeimC2_24730 [Candidatus Heimdallarchaeota archaeon LC_2]|nr:MAG: hypothetical protein HeimC2_24730 [Candidatus Heimdallarchaeota archaeon LC_2]
MKSDEIVQIVKTAKEFESDFKLRKAKHKFLDAASLALKLSKTTQKSDRLSYELIAKELVNYAKDIQLEIILESEGLPSPPGIETPEAKKDIIKIKPREELADKIKPAENVVIYKLMTVKAGGTPLLSYEFAELPDSTQLKLNEILFTGAITAVSQLMEEILEKAIQTIRFEGGVLMIHSDNNLQFILFAQEENELLFDLLKAFASKFIVEFRQIINESARTGMTIAVDEKIKEFICNVFNCEQNEEPEVKS